MAREAALPVPIDRRSVILRAQGAGAMLADEHEVLRCAAASDPPGRALATAQEHLRAGPALDSFATSLPVATRDVTTDGRWPDLRHLVDRATIRAVLSTPLTLPGHCTGWKATHRLAQAMPGAFVQPSVGSVVRF